jgi:hypothetical protein
MARTLEALRASDRDMIEAYLEHLVGLLKSMSS